MSSWLPPTLKTDRLILRPINEDDAPALFEYCQDPEVAKFTMWEAHENIEDTLFYIRSYVKKNYEKEELEPLGICLKESPNKVIGTIGCFWKSRENGSMELAYALSREHWGQGLVAEAGLTLMKFIFDNYKVERLQAHYKVGNESSGRVMEKLGMSKEGIIRSGTYHRKQFWDMVVYSILRREMGH